MTADHTCRCTRPTSNYFCDTCGDEFSRALGDVPNLDEELEITITRQRGIDYRTLGGHKGTSKPSETPSPSHAGAAAARANLKALLVSWALLCHEEHVRHQSHMGGLPEDNLPALSRWLLWRVDGLALHPAGADAVEEIVDAVARCHRMIDRPAPRQYLGDCTECGGDLYARLGGTWATCEACNATTPADEIRERLLTQLDDRLCTAAEIAHLATYLGLDAGREQVRKRINQWHTRRRITAEHAFADEPVFRFGIVWRMLVQDEAAKVSA